MVLPRKPLSRFKPPDVLFKEMAEARELLIFDRIQTGENGAKRP
jgi:hypothetical protein